MKPVYTALLLLFITACGTRLNYIGNSYGKSQDVEVHVDPSSISKPYTIMGKGYIKEGLGDNFIKRIQSLAVSEAKRKGADAILIQDYYIHAASTGLNTTLRTDSVGKGTVTVGNTTVQQNGSQKFTILFLKYK